MRHWRCWFGHDWRRIEVRKVTVVQYTPRGTDTEDVEGIAALYRCRRCPAEHGECTTGMRTWPVNPAWFDSRANPNPKPPTIPDHLPKDF